MVEETFPVLYILARNDLSSMNTGKLAAQCSHASNAFWKEMNDSFIDSEGETNTQAQNLANEWQLSTNQGFGTVLTLEVTEAQMRTAVIVADKLGFVADVVTDPSYPILIDPELGRFLEGHLIADLFIGDRHNYVTIPQDTCAYIFGDKNDPLLGAVVGNFPLHP